MQAAPTEILLRYARNPQRDIDTVRAAIREAPYSGMNDTLEHLVRFGELCRDQSRITDIVPDTLRPISAATIDRYLTPHRDARHPQALSTTKPSHILRTSIPARTAMNGLPPRPGTCELDTLTATDPVIEWTLIRTIRNTAHANIRAEKKWIRRACPTPIHGTEFDNGSEFLNCSVIAWCDDHHIPVTRGRPYQHNNNAHDEQRNGDWVRQHTFRYRYKTDHELQLHNKLHSLVMKRKNHLLPCVKAAGWTHTTSSRKKHVYDAPQPEPSGPFT